jgi:hypothetical protein
VSYAATERATNSPATESAIRGGVATAIRPTFRKASLGAMTIATTSASSEVQVLS